MTTLAGTFTYGYDAIGELTSVQTPAGDRITYQYDPDGNLVAIVDGGTTSVYTTNDLDEYTQGGSTIYQYDANGDLVFSTDGTGTTTYSYNVLGQLTSEVTSSGVVTSYTYDALGYLVSETQNGQTTDNVIDPTGDGGLGDIVAQLDGGGGVVAQYTYGLGLASQVNAAGASAYYDFDSTGDTTQVTGAGGAVVDTYSYLPFGQLLSSSATVSNPFTFVGQWGVMDSGNGLYFMTNRWYSAAEGRFLSPDPTGLAGGSTNLYEYAGNSPTTYIDPSGLDQAGDNFEKSQNQATTLNNAVSKSTNAVPLTDGQNAGLTVGSTAVTEVPGTVGEGAGSTVGGGALTGANAAVATAQGVVQAAASNIGNNAASKLVDHDLAGIGPSDNNSPSPPGPPPSPPAPTPAPPPSPGFFDNAGNVFGSLPQFFHDLGHIFGGSSPSKTVFSGDPNDIEGPAGVGSQGFVLPGAPLSYRIDFTNDATASAGPDCHRHRAARPKPRLEHLPVRRLRLRLDRDPGPRGTYDLQCPARRNGDPRRFGGRHGGSQPRDRSRNVDLHIARPHHT